MERENVDLPDGSAGQNSLTIVTEIPPTTLCKKLTQAGAFILPKGLREVDDKKFKQLTDFEGLIIEEGDIADIVTIKKIVWSSDKYCFLEKVFAEMPQSVAPILRSHENIGPLVPPAPRTFARPRARQTAIHGRLWLPARNHHAQENDEFDDESDNEIFHVFNALLVIARELSWPHTFTCAKAHARDGGESKIQPLQLTSDDFLSGSFTWRLGLLSTPPFSTLIEYLEYLQYLSNAKQSYTAKAVLNLIMIFESTLKMTETL